MRSGERTREHIIERAAELFNRQGYAGASMSDIMAATGLQKGGIYRHFVSKEALALEAFDFAVRRMSQRLSEALEGKENAVDRLRAIAEVYGRLPLDPPVAGGCPVMNTAIESDDGNPELRLRALRAMDGLRALITQTVKRGIARREVRSEVDGDALATLMIATLEGGVMLSMLYRDPVHSRRAGEEIERYLETGVRA